jgi:hypothetical protein
MNSPIQQLKKPASGGNGPRVAAKPPSKRMLLGRYEIERVIDRGQNGKIYKVLDQAGKTLWLGGKAVVDATKKLFTEKRKQLEAGKREIGFEHG